jgi:hypothetical protein
MELGFFSRSSSSFVWRSSTKAANSSLGEWAKQWQRWLLAGWPKLAEKENKCGDSAGLEGRRDFGNGNTAEGFPFL